MKKFLFSILSVALFLPITALGQGTPPPLPLLVYGDITINGSAAPIGTIVSIEKENTEIARVAIVTTGKYSTQIASSYAGSLLSYKVDGSLVIQKTAANPATKASDKIDLTVGSAPVVVSSGGGGSASATVSPSSSASPSATPSATPTPLTAEQQKVDTNNDAKIDVLDFNALMVDWGQAGANLSTDFNSDGTVDIFDFNMLMINWSV